MLQNENGPCPLLAAANCLLLQDRVSLPSSAIRNNVASLSDLTNVLANFALSQHEQSLNNNNNNCSSSGTENFEDEIKRAQSHFQLNELLQIIPKLQDGMDVNPKFTAGITGYEYTSQLTCFDLWKVQLVHGWLLEQRRNENHDDTTDHDDDLYEAIRDRTYNELVEMVIRGHDARDKVPEIQAQINELQQQKAAAAAVQSGPPDLLSGDVETDRAATVPLQEQKKQKLIQDLQDKLDIYASAATMSARVDYFLQSSSHQLTQYGLQCLHADLKANQVVVFFRNNHFSTMVKRKGNDEDGHGHLYLLVTDLGYCNTPLVVWEKLDVINGDTEYVNSDFCTPLAATTTEPGIATSLSPEQLLAQSNQNDADYHLALQLSKQQQQHTLSGAAGMSSNIVNTTGGDGRVEVGMPVSPPRSGTIVALPPAPVTPQLTTTTTAQTQAVMTQEAADRLLAMQLAASDEGGGGGTSSNHHQSSSPHSYYSNNNNDTDASYHLARQLQEEENQQAAARRQAVQQRQQQQAGTTTTTTANRNNRAATTSSSSNSNCTIS